MKTRCALLVLLSVLSIFLGASRLEAFTRTLGRLEARDAFTTTVLADGRVLVAGGRNPAPAGPFKNSCEIYLPGMRPWSLVGSLQIPRANHTATLLQNGNVLVVGGQNSTEILSSAELYDPVADVWREVAPALTSHTSHTATLLPSGKVLIYGGLTQVGPSTVELYDPSSDSWTLLKTLSVPAIKHTATLLPAGKVLFLPEATSGLQPEIYDSQNDSWQTLPQPGGAAYSDFAVQHSATLLESGEVLITRGGCNFCSVLNALLYQPADQTWRFTENQIFQSVGPPRTTLLPSGKVLHIGRAPNYGTFKPQLFDPLTNTWSFPQESSNTDNAIQGPFDFTSTLLPSGEVFLNGFDSKSSYVFQPNLPSWISAGPLSQPRAFLTLTSTHSGAIAIGGKNQNTASGTIEIFSDTSLSWSTLGSLQIPRFKHTATLMPNGKILVAGGQSPSLGTFLPGELVDPQTGQSEILTNLLIRTDGQHTATLLANGEVLFVGGVWNDPRTYLFNLETGTLRQAASLSQFRFQGHSATLLPTGKVLVAGGQAAEITARTELFDPISNQWTDGASLLLPRSNHSAAMIPNLGVGIVGGNPGGLPTNSMLVYDFLTNQWLIAGNLTSVREGQAMVALPNKTLLVVGGLRNINLPTGATESFSIRTGIWRPEPTLDLARSAHQVALTPAGNVLVAGGDPEGPDTETASTEILHFGGSAARKPVIQHSSASLRHDQPFELTVDAGPGAANEANHGGSWSSHTQLPVFRLQALNDGDLHWLVPRQQTPLAENVATYIFPELPDNLNPGQHFLYAVVNGVLSQPRPVTFECSTYITSHPANQTVALGDRATFTVLARGTRSYQWQKDGFDIPGANQPSYTTPATTAADASSRFRVRVDGGCRSVDSESARLDIVDQEAPEVAVTTPSGGEYWPLSRSGETQTRPVAWQMSDNIRLCGVEVALIYSSDGGLTWPDAPSGGGLPASFGDSNNCPFPGVGVTNLIYTIPPAPPSGNIGSLYKIRVRATDMAGNTREAESRNPFFIVQPNADSVQTLILHNLPRMQSVQGIEAADAAALATNLLDLANHPRVLGRLVDLSLVPELTAAYAAWDAEPANDPARANELVQALRVYLDTEILPIYTGIRSLVVVGDDRIFPMARIGDSTALAESTYELSTNSPAGRALAQNHYLTDDLLGVKGNLDLPLSASALRRGAFLSDLPVGRLVEEPQEIIQTIATFISQDGILDLGHPTSPEAKKVLVTGYDFLVDSAQRILTRWQEMADGDLIGQSWTEGQLRTKLDAGYAIYNLNGHAAHFEEGVPGLSPTDIVGLDAAEIYGRHSCGGQSPIDLSGALVYAVGCHGGLTVPGSCATDSDRSLDLPQTFLARGTMAYLANSGYGWGLRHGVGLSERLVELFTEELLVGDRAVQVGEAFRRAKLRYFLELPGFGIYDQKTLLQWSLFGLPFYTLQRGETTSLRSSAHSAIGEASQERPAQESIDGVLVQRSWPESLTAALPPNLVQLNLDFDFSAEGIYRKYDALGQDHPGPGCDEALGCYYTLNGQATGTPDVPILPYLVYNSRLSGTSQHGALWLGGEYQQEGDFRAIFAEVVSNGGIFSDHGATPRLIRPKPYPEQAATGDDSECRTLDTEQNTLVMVTGEVLQSTPFSTTYDLHRRFEEVNIEAFYFNQPGTGNNCDHTGPEITLADDNPNFHQVTGARINWTLKASDPAGVWRVVVVYDGGPDANGRGRWLPIELTQGTDGSWRGSLTTVVPRLTYFIQAVDRHGNVEWVDFSASQGPASGSSPDLPEPIEVELEPSADLSLTLEDPPNPVPVGMTFTYQLAVQNHSPSSAHQLEVDLELSPLVSYRGSGGEGWTCSMAGSTLQCRRDSLPAGTSSTFPVFVKALTGGVALTTASLDALEPDPNAANDTATQETFIASSADLSIRKSAGEAIVGKRMTYELEVTNHGPEAVSGAPVTDFFPTGLTEIVWICLATPGSSCGEAGDGNLSDVVHLLAGGKVLYRAEALVTAEVPDTLVNTATITNPAGDPQPGNNSSTVESVILLFKDGFESGDTRCWSEVVGASAGFN